MFFLNYTTTRGNQPSRISHPRSDNPRSPPGGDDGELQLNSFVLRLFLNLISPACSSTAAAVIAALGWGGNNAAAVLTKVIKARSTQICFPRVSGEC